jgi:hypothetical protein
MSPPRLLLAPVPLSDCRATPGCLYSVPSSPSSTNRWRFRKASVPAPHGTVRADGSCHHRAAARTSWAHATCYGASSRRERRGTGKPCAGKTGHWWWYSSAGEPSGSYGGCPERERPRSEQICCQHPGHPISDVPADQIVASREDAVATLPRSMLRGPAVDGLMSNAKIAVGVASVQQALGISTMPLIRPSTGAVLRMM